MSEIIIKDVAFGNHDADSRLLPEPPVCRDGEFLLRAGNCGRAGIWDCGFIFDTVPVKKNAKIISGELRLYLFAFSGEPLDPFISRIYGWLTTGNLLVWCDGGHMPSLVPVTDAYEEWLITTSSSPNGWYVEYLDVTALITELVEQAGWEKNYDMGIVIRNYGSGYDRFVNVVAFEMGGSARLTLEVATTRVILNPSNRFESVVK